MEGFPESLRELFFYPLRRTPVYNRAPYRLVLWVKTLLALNAGAVLGFFIFFFFRRRLCHGAQLSPEPPGATYLRFLGDANANQGPA